MPGAHKGIGHDWSFVVPSLEKYYVILYNKNLDLNSKKSWISLTAVIAKESYDFNTVAANRIGEIQQSTHPSEWFWINKISHIAEWIMKGKNRDEIRCMALRSYNQQSKIGQSLANQILKHYRKEIANHL